MCSPLNPWGTHTHLACGLSRHREVWAYVKMELYRYVGSSVYLHCSYGIDMDCIRDVRIKHMGGIIKYVYRGLTWEKCDSTLKCGNIMRRCGHKVKHGSLYQTVWIFTGYNGLVPSPRKGGQIH